jgi:hypothetical protein
MKIPFEIAIKIVRMSDHISAYNFLEAIGMNREQIVQEMSRFVKIFIYDGKEDVPEDCEFCYVDDCVKQLEMMTFSHHIYIQSVRLPDRITRINPGSFSMCYSLKNIKLPKNLVSIGVLGFGNCSSLKEITIPKNVIRIETYAFTSCINLETIHMKCKEPKWGEFVFIGCRKLSERWMTI